MLSRFALPAVALFPCCLPTLAQSTTVLMPSTATSAPGTSYDNASWGNYRPPGCSGLRLQLGYPGTGFTARGIGSRIAIQGAWFRSSPAAPSPVGAVAIAAATVAMSTARVPATALGNDYAANHGTDLATVFSGPIQVLSSAAQGELYVHVAFTQPFAYDPLAGDLLFDISYPYAGLTHQPFGSYARYADAMNGGGGLVFGDSALALATHSYPGVSIVQFDYTVVPGAAGVASRGTGCVELRSSAYEQFQSPASPFDLANRRVQWTRLAEGYAQTAGAGSWTAPTGATALTLGDDSCSPPIALPFPFPYFDRNGTLQNATQIVVASNGYVWLDGAQTVSDFSPTVAEFCNQAPRIAAHWTDLTPNLGGTISYGTSAGGSAFHVTWNQVPEYDHPANLTSVQLSLANNGDFCLDFAATNPSLPSIVGWSPGLGALPAPGLDLSAPGSRQVRRDTLGLQLTALSRPVLNRVHGSRIDNIAGDTTLGVFCLGLTPAQVPLDGFGLTGGCTQWSAWDVAELLLPTGSQLTRQVFVPGMPTLVGLPLHEQAAMFSPGLNPAGIVVSNGLVATVGSN